MIRITEDQALAVHAKMIEVTGGMDGVRDRGLLDSALNVPFQTFDGNELYPSVLMKSAAMCRGIISDHPFADGNKRTGIHLMLIFLKLNGIDLSYTQKELIDLGFSIADGSCGYDEILEWLIDHS